ncbi:MAG: hypothetical protein M1812_007864, partial [Candelaria pacifica]
ILRGFSTPGALFTLFASPTKTNAKSLLLSSQLLQNFCVEAADKPSTKIMSFPGTYREDDTYEEEEELLEEAGPLSDVENLQNALPETVETERKGKVKTSRQSINAIYRRRPENKDDFTERLNHEVNITYRTNKLLAQQMDGFRADMQTVKQRIGDLDRMEDKIDGLETSMETVLREIRSLSKAQKPDIHEHEYPQPP